MASSLRCTEQSIICGCGAVKSREDFASCRECWLAGVSRHRPFTRVDQWCRENGVSLLSLSRSSGVAYSTLRDLIYARRVARGATVRALSRATGLNEDAVREVQE